MYGGVTSQSSTYSNAYGCHPWVAIDGNTNGQWTGSSCTHTHNEYEAWWRVDLGDARFVAAVSTFNREDCCGERLTNYRITVGDSEDGSQNPACGGDNALFTGANEVECFLEGRYI
ncbi:MAG: hypothetical protein GY861_24160 [bacterium]|nr:hypothetical protein [bacterium]